LNTLWWLAVVAQGVKVVKPLVVEVLAVFYLLLVLLLLQVLL
jgi:hypothetical protein